MEERPKASDKPPTHQSYKRNRYGGNDRRGGGGIVPCKYHVYSYENRYVNVKEILNTALEELKFQGTERLEIVEQTCSLIGAANSCPW